MNVNGFALRDKNGLVVQKWTAIPARIDLPNGDALMGADKTWKNDDFSISATAWEVPDPPPAVPEIITDRQFFQQLAIDGIITQDEALAAVGAGELPDAMTKLINALPASKTFGAKMLLKGSIEFHRNHQLVNAFGATYFGLSGDDLKNRLDQLWIDAGKL